MTEEQIAALVKLEARGNRTGFSSDFEAEARNVLPRLLEERKRLLEALRELASSPRLDTDEEDFTDHKRAVEALDFADEEAP